MSSFIFNFQLHFKRQHIAAARSVGGMATWIAWSGDRVLS
jgi:hypothetical protein